MGVLSCCGIALCARGCGKNASGAVTYMLARIFRRSGELSAAHLVIRVEEYIFDFLLYPYMLYGGGSALLRMAGYAGADARTGYWLGCAIMLTTSTALNLVYLWTYDRTRRDWFGIEQLRHWEARPVPWLPEWTRPVWRFAVFAGLSIWANPLFATLWLRSRDHQFVMAQRDWGVFWLAIIIANAAWIGIIGAVAVVVRTVWM